MEKVKIPREVADAIEKLRSMDFKITNWDIVYAFAASKSDEYPALIEFANNNFDTFLKAIVNGYEVEQTPEDKVRYYIEALNKETDMIVHGTAPYWIAKGHHQGVMAVVEILGLNIGGVNS